MTGACSQSLVAFQLPGCIPISPLTARARAQKRHTTVDTAHRRRISVSLYPLELAKNKLKKLESNIGVSM